MRLFLFVIFLVVSVSCELTNPTLEEEKVAVDGFLVAGQRFEKVSLRKVLTFEDLSRGSRNLDGPVSNAQVVIDDGLRVVNLVEDTSSIPNRFPPKTNHGNYILSNQDTLVIQNNRFYKLQVTAFGATILASTRTPSQTNVVLVSPIGSIRYPSDEVVLKSSKDSTVGGFLVFVRVDNSKPPNPTYGGYNYFFTSDSIFIVPWKNVPNLGRITIFVYAFDHNYFEYIRTRKLGNPTQSLLQPASFVENGYGLFASAAFDSISFDIL